MADEIKYDTRVPNVERSFNDIFWECCIEGIGVDV